MKIITVEAYILNTGKLSFRPVVTRILTDEGITGYGEASLGFSSGPEGALGMIREIAPLVIGMDPMAHEAVWNRMYYDSFWGQGGGAAIMSAISAIDIAVWDIRGKALGVSVGTLLGGRMRDSLRAYASQIQFGWSKEGITGGKGYSPDLLAEQAAAAVSDGYDAVKVNLLTYAPDGSRYGILKGPLPGKVLREAERRMKAVREAVGEDVDILLENHGFTDKEAALSLVDTCAPYRAFFIEEPCTQEEVQTCAAFASRCPVPVAGGERIYGKRAFANFFEARALAVAQPDVGSSGGITETKKICDMADTFDVNIQTHLSGSPIITAASVQLESAVPNFLIHEHIVTCLSPAYRDLCIYDDQPVGGRLSVPDRPGIGQELTGEAMEKALVKAVIS